MPEFVLLLPRHLLHRVQNELAVVFAGLTQQAPQLAEILRTLAGTSPRMHLGRVSSGHGWHLRRLLAVVEESVHGNFESARQLFQGLNRRNRMPVFDTGNVAAK